MVRLDTDECRRRLAATDHGVLATVSTDRRPHAVPVCFALVDEVLAIPVDDVKPKSGRPLARVRNVESTGVASLLVEHWDRDDWRRLWWVRADVTADPGDTTALAAALRAKYPQYADASFLDVLTLRVHRLTGWSAASG